MFHLTIDGKKLTGSEGQTILDVARAGGIEIPTLCHDERLKPYGSCGICVVQMEGNDNLVRSCATAASDGMVVYTDNPRIRKSRQMTLELLLSDHNGDCRPPCSKACPANTDCQGYVGLIANGKYKESTALIKEAIPVPLSIGLVCPHPCEDACRRQLVEEPVAIAALKAFAAWQDLHDPQPYQVQTKPATGKKAAIVGSGPAGLTAAFFLAKEGHQVTVYDAMPEFGGMLRYGIPEYRLPKKLLDKEIDNIRELGVKFVPNTRVNRDMTLEELCNKYDAVFLGIGAWTSSRIDCPGEDLPGVLGGIDFLRDVAMGRPVEIGPKVAIIGGGNTAMDAARTSVRLGASEVMVLYRRTRAEMPAEDLEIQEAMEEGVQFHFLVAPAEITAENGRINAIRMQVMELGEPDKSGRRRPVPTGEEKVISVDNVIAAIGQQVNTAGFEGLEQTRWGSLMADESNYLTSLPGVFAGGDGVTGPGIAIEAVAQGKGAARAICDYLDGEKMVYTKPYLSEKKVTAEDFAVKVREPRAKLKHADPVVRRTNFELVSQVFDSAEAEREAGRCLECGCMDYFECKLIEYAGQYQANPIPLAGAKHPVPVYSGHPNIIRDAGKCIFCSLCIRTCDEIIGAGAWGLVHRGFETMIQPELDLPLEMTDCISCGECVNVCPTGALTARDLIAKPVPLALSPKLTNCSQCSMACPQVIENYGSLQVRALPPQGGLLCERGRFEWNSEVEDDINCNTKSPISSWEEATGDAAQLINRDGKWEKINDADVILMVGSFKLSQVGAIKARAAANAGAKLIIISQERTLADNIAFQKISDNNSVFWREVLAAVIKNGWYSSEFMQKHADRLSSLAGNMEGLAIGEQAVQLAEVFSKSEKTMIMVDGYSVDSEELGLIAELILMTEPAESPGRIIVVTPGAN